MENTRHKLEVLRDVSLPIAGFAAGVLLTKFGPSMCSSLCSRLSSAGRLPELELVEELATAAPAAATTEVRGVAGAGLVSSNTLAGEALSDETVSNTQFLHSDTRQTLAQMSGIGPGGPLPGIGRPPRFPGFVRSADGGAAGGIGESKSEEIPNPFSTSRLPPIARPTIFPR